MYNFRLCAIIFLYFAFHCTSCQQIDTKAIKIWGPGLSADKIVMPARYFFIDSGVSYSSIQSLLPIFNVVIQGVNKFNIDCRVWLNILDRKDGSFVVRYKLYEVCYKFQIHITYKNQHIGASPYIISKSVFADECNCPEDNISGWLSNFECSKTYEQIDRDLLNFPEVNYTEMRPKILSLYNIPTAYSICDYIVQDNEIYRKCYGKYVGFNMFMDSILLSLTRKVKLPNMEMFVNLGDWPLAPKSGSNLPIFSWCGSSDSFDIVMPTYDVTESTLENMGRVMLDMLSVQGNIKNVWPEKKPQVFWRGRDSNQRRLNLIDISRTYPDLFNVSMTNFFFFRNEIDKYGPKAEHVSFFSFFDYKYQLNIDGTVAAYRFPYLLAGDSLVFKQDSKYYEYFYNSLKPGYHYLQVNEDLSNLVDQVQWAISNDDEARRIAKTIIQRSFVMRFSSKYSAKALLNPENRVKCMHKFQAMTVKQGSKQTKVKRMAAVLIPIYVKNDEVSLLFTLRATSLKTHRGQVSFPGGMQDKDDSSARHTALRETEEELGIRAEDIDVWGIGNPIPRLDMSILPVVGCIRTGIPLAKLPLNTDEVEEVFTVTLKELCNPKFNRKTQFKGTYSMPVFFGGPHRVWGLTAFMTFMFLKALVPAEDYTHKVTYVPDIKSIMAKSL